MVNHIVKETADRISNSLRDADIAARLVPATFAIAISLAWHLDLEVVIQMAGRIQRSVADHISVAGTDAYISVSIGFNLADKLRDPTGEALMQSAIAALIEAQRSGPSAIASYSFAMRDRIRDRNKLSEQVA